MGASEGAGRSPFSGRRVVLGVCGGIAAYKSITLARELALAGAGVDVVLTRSALDFVRPLSFEAVTGGSSHVDAYEAGDPLLHIRLAKQADVVVIAPATANFIARAAAGMADDLLTSILLATVAPIIVCPAMNDLMYGHPQTRANLERLDEIGYRLFGPAEGRLAWGEGEGKGRMEEPSAILERIGRTLSDGKLSGLQVLVTAGPTREPIDPVRFIGNRSSGRMGYALAATAWRLGADVTLVSGPSALATPTGVTRIDVETAEQMYDRVSEHLPNADVLVMAAAVADFRPGHPSDRKIKKEGGAPSPIALERTRDILHESRNVRKPGAIIVGFALETDTPLENGRKKLVDKDLDLLVVNDAGEPGAGFEVPTNRVTILDRRGEAEEIPLLPKGEVAERILARVAALLERRE